jgi:tetratricopeptide (TPR) repeat protein
MRTTYRTAKINVKVLIVLLLVVFALGVSLFTARQVRRTVRARNALQEGAAAFEVQDWTTAYEQYSLYLGAQPDDIEVLKRFASAGLAIRPVKAGAVKGAMSAYRRLVQLCPEYEESYEKLAMLYTSFGKYDELAYIAGLKLEVDPNSLQAPLWLSDALISMNKY